MNDYQGVAVVGSHCLTREGAVAAMRDDARLHVVLQASSIAEAMTTDAAYDACLVTDTATGTPREARALYARVPTVVVVGGDDWRHHLRPWLTGAVAVVGARVGGVALADAVSGVRQGRGRAMTPTLARALVAAARHHGVPVRPPFASALDAVAGGRSCATALERSGLDDDEWERDLTSLSSSLPDADHRGVDAESGFRPGSMPPEATIVSGREREVLAAYADGETYPQIAARLHLSEKTVRNHVTNAMDRVGVHRTDGETRWCFAVFVSGRHPSPEKLRRRLGLVEPGSGVG